MISRSFTAISPYITPAPGETWAVRARWYLIKTDYLKEFHVNAALRGKEFQTFLPTVLRVYGKSRGKTRPPREIALVPGKMFVKAELSDFVLKAIGTQYLTGYERNDDEFPMPVEIPDDQMQVFIDTHQEYLSEAQKRLALGKALGRGAKGRKKTMPFSEGLSVLKERMEGRGDK